MSVTLLNPSLFLPTRLAEGRWHTIRHHHRHQHPRPPKPHLPGRHEVAAQRAVDVGRYGVAELPQGGRDGLKVGGHRRHAVHGAKDYVLLVERHLQPDMHTLSVQVARDSACAVRKEQCMCSTQRALRVQYATNSACAVCKGPCVCSTHRCNGRAAHGSNNVVLLVDAYIAPVQSGRHDISLGMPPGPNFSAVKLRCTYMPIQYAYKYTYDER